MSAPINFPESHQERLDYIRRIAIAHGWTPQDALRELLDYTPRSAVETWRRWLHGDVTPSTSTLERLTFKSQADGLKRARETAIDNLRDAESKRREESGVNDQH